MFMYPCHGLCGTCSVKVLSYPLSGPHLPAYLSLQNYMRLCLMFDKVFHSLNPDAVLKISIPLRVSGYQGILFQLKVSYHSSSSLYIKALIDLYHKEQLLTNEEGADFQGPIGKWRKAVVKDNYTAGKICNI